MKPTSTRLIVGRATLVVTAAAMIQSSVAAAQSPSSFQLSGLTFDCKGCTLASDSPCLVSLPRGDAPVRCDLALPQLLKAALAGYDEARPSPAELRRFLLGESISSETAVAAIALMLKSDAGRKAIAQDAYPYAAKYSTELSGLVSGSPEQKEVWMAFWRLPAREGISLDSRLRSSIVARIEDLGEADLFADLSVADPAGDLKELRTYESAFGERRTQLFSSIRRVREVLERCREPLIRGTMAEGCSEEDISKLPEPARQYVERVKVRWVVAAAERGEFSASQLVSRLAGLNTENARTPALHEAVVKALTAVTQAPAAEKEALLTAASHEVLKTFSANDGIIANRYARLLIERADELFIAGRIEDSLNLVGQSFEVVAKPLDYRVQFLQKVAASPEWSAAPALQAKFTEVVKRYEPREPWYRLSQQKLIGIFGLLTGLSFIWLMFAYAYRQRRIALERAEVEAEVLLEAELIELRELREFFGLKRGEGEATLTKIYRRMAKEAHPDVKGSDHTEFFQDLNERYTRLKELLSRLPDVDESTVEGDDLDEE